MPKHIDDWRAGKSRDYTMAQRQDILSVAFAEATKFVSQGKYWEPVRIALMDEEGRTPLSQTKPGEAIFAPGIVYRDVTPGVRHGS